MQKSLASKYNTLLSFKTRGGHHLEPWRSTSLRVQSVTCISSGLQVHVQKGRDTSAINNDWYIVIRKQLIGIQIIQYIFFSYYQCLKSYKVFITLFLFLLLILFRVSDTCQEQVYIEKIKHPALWCPAYSNHG